MKNQFRFTIFLTAAFLIIASRASAVDKSFESLPEILAPGQSSRALVCPYTVTNGAKQIGNVIVAVFAAPDATCNTAPIGNAAWAGRGGTPTLTNGSHSLSNDALASVGLTALTTTVNIQIEIHNAANTQYALLCMPATVVSGAFTCTGGPYTIDLNNL